MDGNYYDLTKPWPHEMRNATPSSLAVPRSAFAYLFLPLELVILIVSLTQIEQM